MLAQKQNEANSALNDIVSDVQTRVADDKRSYPNSGVWAGEEAFLANLADLNKSWRIYQGALCKTEVSGAYGGSGQEDMMAECQIRETEVFINRLGDYKRVWGQNKN